MWTVPPTGAGCWFGARVLANVAIAAPSSVTGKVGWKFHSEKRKSRITGWWNVTAAPTRTALLGVSQGSGWLACDPVGLNVKLDPSSRVTIRAALSAATAWAWALPAGPASVGWCSGVVPLARVKEPKKLASKLSDTVKSPAGAISSPSWVSFWASVARSDQG